MEKIIYLKNPQNYSDSSEFIAYLPDLDSEEELHNKLFEILKFPNYYGENWNALNDCLKDFHWIEKKGVTLVHNSLPKISLNDLKIYIEIIFDAAECWEENDNHYLKLVFPIEVKGILEKINKRNH